MVNHQILGTTGMPASDGETLLCIKVGLWRDMGRVDGQQRRRSAISATKFRHGRWQRRHQGGNYTRSALIKSGGKTATRGNSPSSQNLAAIPLVAVRPRVALFRKPPGFCTGITTCSGTATKDENQKGEQYKEERDDNSSNGTSR